jgi:hypothetical protein
MKKNRKTLKSGNPSRRLSAALYPSSGALEVIL